MPLATIPNAIEPSPEKDLVRMKFLTRYGDYAGRLYRNKILSETSSEPTIQILTACVNELQ